MIEHIFIVFHRTKEEVFDQSASKRVMVAFVVLLRLVKKSKHLLAYVDVTVVH